MSTAGRTPTLLLLLLLLLPAVVPEGYFLRGPGQVAACPKGEYKAGTSTTATCTKCAVGVTTESEGSNAEADCKVLLPGVYASVVEDGIIKTTKKCPQVSAYISSLSTCLRHMPCCRLFYVLVPVFAQR